MKMMGLLIISLALLGAQPAAPASRQIGTVELAFDRPVDSAGAILRLPNSTGKVNLRVFPARDSGDSMHFIVEDLPHSVYDIYVEIDGHRVEGVDLAVEAPPGAPVFDWWLPGERLTARNFDPAEQFDEDAAVSEQDERDAIRRKFRLNELQQRFDALGQVRRFENFFRVIYASGTAQTATALVELRRDGGHYAEKNDEVVWRAEVWTFTWAWGAWSTEKRAARVLEQVRMQRDEFERFDRLYDPSLGGISVEAGKTAICTYKLPGVFDNTMGKASIRAE
jgi:hypothetical protein